MASPRKPNTTEPFPSYTPGNEENNDAIRESSQEQSRRGSITSRSSKPPAQAVSILRTRTRTGSLGKAFLESNPPLGMWQATGEIGSKIPTLPEIRNGAFANEGWTHEGQMEHRGTNPHEIHARRLARTSSASTRTRKSSMGANMTPTISEERHEFFPKRAPTMPSEPLLEESSTVQSSEPTFAAAEGVSQLDGSEKVGGTTRLSERSPSTKRLSKTRKPAVTEKHLATTESGSRRDYSTPPSTESPAALIESGPDATGTYPNGYRFPKKHTWTQSINIGLKAYWKFLKSPFGVVLTIYGLNVVGWGAMIFFVLLNAAPAMCHPSCNSNDSARKKWIEVDSQVLNGLFCVTAFGLLPWRARDFYYLMRWRIRGDHNSHRRLAGIYRGWYRLPGSETLEEHVGPPPVQSKKKSAVVVTEAPPAYSEEDMSKLESNPVIPLPVTSMPEPPLTGLRAPPSRSWTLDAVIWLYMWNTIFQVLLCFWMWHWNRINRPSWGTGVWITLGCLVAIFAGVVAMREGLRVKKIEGIPVQEYDVLESIEDYHARKAKEDKKLEKHESHKHVRDGHVSGKPQKVLHSEKLKGHEWFTRH